MLYQAWWKDSQKFVRVKLEGISILVGSSVYVLFDPHWLVKIESLIAVIAPRLHLTEFSEKWRRD